MTIMSYGTALGGCPIPRQSPPRIYVLSGYPIPGTSTVLGEPCGSASGSWNRKQFEDSWNTIAGFYSSQKCLYVDCPTSPMVPATGCVCSDKPFTSTGVQSPPIEPVPSQPVPSPPINPSPAATAAPAPSCKAGGRTGKCLDTRTQTCPGGRFGKRCRGGKFIRCCI